MNSFAANLASPEWWLGVVAVGIAINVLSTWLMRRNADLISSMSKKLATRSEKKEARRNDSIHEMKNNPAALRRMIIQTDRNRGLAALELIFGFQGLIGAVIIQEQHPMPSLIMLCFAGILTGLGMRLFFLGEDQTQMVQSAIPDES